MGTDLDRIKAHASKTPSHALLRKIAMHADQRVIRAILLFNTPIELHGYPGLHTRVDALCHALKPCTNRGVWYWIKHAPDDFAEACISDPEAIAPMLNGCSPSLPEVRIAWATLLFAYRQGYEGKNPYSPEAEGKRLIKACVIAAGLGFEVMIAARVLAGRSIPFWWVQGDAFADFRDRVRTLEALAAERGDALREIAVQSEVEHASLTGDWGAWQSSNGIRRGSRHWIRLRRD